MAAIEVIVEAGQAQRALDNLDKNFEKVDKSIDRMVSAVERLEKSFTRIAISVKNAIDPILRMEKALNKFGGRTLQIAINESQKYAEQNELLHLMLRKLNTQLQQTAKNLSSKATKLNKLQKELNKAEIAAFKTGKKVHFLGMNVTYLKNVSDALSIPLTKNEYLLTMLGQAAATFIAQNLVGYLIRMTDQFKLMESRLRIVNSGFSTLNTNLKSAVSVAMETRQSLFAIGNLMARVGRNTRELQEDTLKLATATATISKSFQIAGATAEEARNAIVQLSQALASGRLQGDELRSILELAPTLAESISKAIGITVGQLRAFAREGLITTEIMLSAVAESVEEVNEKFARIRPTVSQGLTNVQTAMQAVLGFNVDLKAANDALANSFLSLANQIKQFALNGKSIEGLTSIIKDFAQNIIPIAKSLLNIAKNLAILVGVSVTLSLILKGINAINAAGALTAAIFTRNIGVLAGFSIAIGSIIKPLIILGGLLFSFKTFAEDMDKFKFDGLIASSTESLSQIMKRVRHEIEMTNKAAADQGEEGLKPLEIATIKLNNLREGYQNSARAIEELNSRIEQQKVAIEKTRKETNKYADDFKKIEKELYNFIEMVKDVGIAVYDFLKLVLYDGLGGLVFNAIMAVTLPFQFVQDLFTGEDIAGEQFRLIKQNFKDIEKQAVEFGKSFTKVVDTTYMGREQDTPISRMFFGKTVKELEAEMAELNKMLETEKVNQEEIRAELKKLEEEHASELKKTRDLMLKQFRASTANTVQQYRLEGQLIRQAIKDTFERPFNIQSNAIQSALSQFALGLQKDFSKKLKELVPDASFDFIEFFNIGSPESAFNTSGFKKRLQESGKQISKELVFGAREYNEKGEVVKPGELEKMLGLDSLVGLVTKLPEVSKAIEDAGVNSILADQLSMNLEELVEKYGAALLKALISSESQMNKIIKQERINVEDQRKSLAGQNEIFEHKLKLGNTRIEQIAAETKELEIQSKVELEAYKESLRRQGFDLNFNTTGPLTDIQKATKELIESKEKLIEENQKLITQEYELSLFEKRQDIEKQMFSLNEELRLRKQGVNELEIARKIEEARIQNELDINKQLFEQKDITQDQFDLTKKFLEFKKDQLKAEEDITEQIRIQKGLQKTKEEIAEERVRNQVEAAAARRAGTQGVGGQLMSFFGVERGAEKQIADDLNAGVSALLAAQIKATEFSITPTGNIEYSKALTERVSKDLLDELVNQGIALERERRVNPAANIGGGFFQSILSPRGSSPTDSTFGTGVTDERRQGGFIDGPSHSKGGVKGFLYGHPLELEGGEYVISKKAVSKYGPKLFDLLNTMKFESGGSLMDILGYDEKVEMKYDLFDKINKRNIKLTYVEGDSSSGMHGDGFYAHYLMDKNEIQLNKKFYGDKYSEGSLGLEKEIQALSHEFLHAINDISDEHVHEQMGKKSYKELASHIRNENKELINKMSDLVHKDEQDLVYAASTNLDMSKYNTELLRMYDKKIASPILEKTGIGSGNSELLKLAREFNLKDENQKRRLISDMYSLMIDEGDNYLLDESGLGRISSKSFINYNDIGLIKRGLDSGHTDIYNKIQDRRYVSEGGASYIDRGTEEIVAEVFTHLTNDKYGLSSVRYPELSELFRNAYGKNLIPELNLEGITGGSEQKGFFEKISDYFFSFFSSGGILEKGGMLKGPSHSKGGIKGVVDGQLIEMEGGEYIISKNAVDKYGIDIFNSLNARKFEPGGLVSSKTPASQLVGDYIPVETAIRIINNLRSQGRGKDAEKFARETEKIMDRNIKEQKEASEERLKIKRAEDAARKGVKTFFSDGRVAEMKDGEFSIDTPVQEKLKNTTVELIESKQKEIDQSKEIEEQNTINLKSNGLVLATEKERHQINKEVNLSIAGLGYAANTLEKDFDFLSKSPALGYADSTLSQGTLDIMPQESPGVIMGTLGFGASVISGAVAQGMKDSGLKEDIGLLVKGFASGNPIEGLQALMVKQLLKNERFQKALERFFSLFYDLFDEFAEGFALVFESIVDALEPLRPLMKMVGGSLREILRSLTKFVQPVAKFIEALQPILVYLSGALQIFVAFVSSIVDFFAGILDEFVDAFLGFFDVDVSSKYKSLNLLRQEKDILTEINSSISGLADTLKDMNDVIFDIVNSTLNIAAPSTKLELATQRYQELFIAASAFGADESVVNEFTQFSKQYLEQAQSVLKTSAAYQQLYVQVIEDLESLQATSAVEVGQKITESIRSGLFQLEVAGSEIGENIVSAVDIFKEGIISFDDLTRFIGFKLSQVQEDIDIKEFSDFGSIGDNVFESNVIAAFEEYRKREYSRIEDSLSGAESASSLSSDFARLFGIDLSGQRLSEAFLEQEYKISEAIAESEMLLARERGGSSLARLQNAQPVLGDVTAPPEISDDLRGTDAPPTLTFEGFDLVKILESIATAIFDALLEALNAVFTEIDKFLKALFSFIEDLSITAVKFLEELFDAIFGENTAKALEALGKFFEEILTDTVTALQGVGKFFETALSDTITAISGIGEFFSEIFGDSFKLLKPLEGLTSFFQEIITATGQLSPTTAIQQLFNNILDFTTDVLSPSGVFKTIFDAIFNNTGSLNIIDAFGDLLDEIFSSLTGDLSIGDALGRIIGRIFFGAKALTGLEGIQKFFNEIIGTKLNDPLEAIKKLIESLVSSAADPTKAIQSFISAVLDGATVNATQAITAFFNAISTGVLDAAAVIQSLFDTIITSSITGDVFIKDFFTSFERNVKEIFMFKNPFYKILPDALGGGEEYLFKFEEGGSVNSGYLSGPRHSEGGILASVGGKELVELEGGEFIIRRDAVNNVGTDFLENINNRYGEGGKVKKYASGGILGSLLGGVADIDYAKSFSEMPELIQANKLLGAGVHRGSGIPKSESDSDKYLGHQDTALNKTIKVLDIDIQTAGFLKDLIGNHGLVARLFFPFLFQGGKEQSEVKLFDEGGYIEPKVGARSADITIGETGSAKLDEIKNMPNLPLELNEVLEGFVDVVKKLLETFGRIGGRFTDFGAAFKPLADISIKGQGKKATPSIFKLALLTQFLAGVANAAGLVPRGADMGDINFGIGKGISSALLPTILLAGGTGENEDGSIKLSFADQIEETLRDIGFSQQLIDILSALYLVSTVLQAGGMNMKFSSGRKSATNLYRRFTGNMKKMTGNIFEDGGVVPSYSEGGMAVGPSHQSGMVGLTRSGYPFMFEGGEYIINKKSTERIGESRLDQLNSYGEGGKIPEFLTGGSDDPLRGTKFISGGARYNPIFSGQKSSYEKMSDRAFEEAGEYFTGEHRIQDGLLMEGAMAYTPFNFLPLLISGLLGASSALFGAMGYGSRFVFGPAMLAGSLAYAGQRMSGRTRPDYMSVRDEQMRDLMMLMGFMFGSEFTLYPTEGPMMGPGFRSFTGLIAGMHTSTLPYSVEALGMDEFSTPEKLFALYTTLFAGAGALDYGEATLKGDFRAVGKRLDPLYDFLMFDLEKGPGKDPNLLDIMAFFGKGFSNALVLFSSMFGGSVVKHNVKITKGIDPEESILGSGGPIPEFGDTGPSAYVGESKATGNALDFMLGDFNPFPISTPSKKEDKGFFASIGDFFVDYLFEPMRVFMIDMFGSGGIQGGNRDVLKNVLGGIAGGLAFSYAYPKQSSEGQMAMLAALLGGMGYYGYNEFEGGGLLEFASENPFLTAGLGTLLFGAIFQRMRERFANPKEHEKEASLFSMITGQELRGLTSDKTGIMAAILAGTSAYFGFNNFDNETLNGFKPLISLLTGVMAAEAFASVFLHEQFKESEGSFDKYYRSLGSAQPVDDEFKYFLKYRNNFWNRGPRTNHLSGTGQSFSDRELNSLRYVKQGNAIGNVRNRLGSDYSSMISQFHTERGLSSNPDTSIFGINDILVLDPEELSVTNTGLPAGSKMVNVWRAYLPQLAASSSLFHLHRGRSGEESGFIERAYNSGDSSIYRDTYFGNKSLFKYRFGGSQGPTGDFTQDAYQMYPQDMSGPFNTSKPYTELLKEHAGGIVSDSYISRYNKWRESNNLPTFASGGSVNTGMTTPSGQMSGPSHQSGMLGLTKTGVPFLFEGGEYIINKKAANVIGAERLDSLNSLQYGGEVQRYDSEGRVKESSFFDPILDLLPYLGYGLGGLAIIQLLLALQGGEGEKFFDIGEYNNENLRNIGKNIVNTGVDVLADPKKAIDTITKTVELIGYGAEAFTQKQVDNIQSLGYPEESLPYLYDLITNPEKLYDVLIASPGSIVGAPLGGVFHDYYRGAYGSAKRFDGLTVRKLKFAGLSTKTANSLKYTFADESPIDTYYKETVTELVKLFQGSDNDYNIFMQMIDEGHPIMFVADDLISIRRKSGMYKTMKSAGFIGGTESLENPDWFVKNGEMGPYNVWETFGWLVAHEAKHSQNYDNYGGGTKKKKFQDYWEYYINNFAAEEENASIFGSRYAYIFGDGERQEIYGPPKKPLLRYNGFNEHFFGLSRIGANDLPNESRYFDGWFNDHPNSGGMSFYGGSSYSHDSPIDSPPSFYPPPHINPPNYPPFSPYPPSFGSGGSLKSVKTGAAIGPDHQSGMLGVTKQGGPFLFEGGEYIINKTSAKMLGKSRLDALNSMGVGGRIPMFDEGETIEERGKRRRSEVFDNHDFFKASADGSFSLSRVMNNLNPTTSGGGFGFLDYLVLSMLLGGAYNLQYIMKDGGGIPEFSDGNSLKALRYNPYLRTFAGLASLFVAGGAGKAFAGDEGSGIAPNPLLGLAGLGLTGLLFNYFISGLNPDFTMRDDAGKKTPFFSGSRGFYFGSGGKIPMLQEGGGAGFSYEDIGAFFSMVASPFISVYDFLFGKKGFFTSNFVPFSRNRAGNYSRGKGGPIFGYGGRIPEFGNGANLPIEALLFLGGVFGGAGIDFFYSGREGIRGTREGERARNYTQLLGGLGFLAGASLSAKRRSEDNLDRGLFAPLVAMFGGTLAFDALSKLGYLGEDTSGILPEYKEFPENGLGGGIPEFRKGGMTDQEKFLFSLIFGSLRGVQSYYASTRSANILHSKPGNIGGAFSDGLEAFLTAFVPISLLYGSGGTIPSFQGGSLLTRSAISAIGAGSIMSSGSDIERRGLNLMNTLGILFGFDFLSSGISGNKTYLSSIADYFLSMGSGGRIPEFNTGGVFGKMSDQQKLILSLLAGIGIYGVSLDESSQPTRTFTMNQKSIPGTPDHGKAFEDATGAFLMTLLASSLAYGTGYGSGGRIRTLQAGGMAKGPSHQSGMVGYAPGGGPFMFEGGEYIINKRSASKIGEDNLNQINSFGSGGRLPEFLEGQEIYGRRDLGFFTDDGEYRSLVTGQGSGGSLSESTLINALENALLSAQVAVVGYSNEALLQLAQVFRVAGQPNMDDLFTQLMVMSVLTGPGVGMDPTGASSALSMIMLTRQMAGDDQGDKNLATVAATTAAVVAYLSGYGAAASLAALVAGTIFGDKERYLADFDLDAQKDLEDLHGKGIVKEMEDFYNAFSSFEQFQKSFDEMFNVSDGKLVDTYVHRPQKALTRLDKNIATELEKSNAFRDFEPLRREADKLIDAPIEYLEEGLKQFVEGIRTLPEQMRNFVYSQTNDLSRMVLSIILAPFIATIEFLNNPALYTNAALSIFVKIKDIFFKIVGLFFNPILEQLSNPETVAGALYLFLAKGVLAIEKFFESLTASLNVENVIPAALQFIYESVEAIVAFGASLATELKDNPEHAILVAGQLTAVIVFGIGSLGAILAIEMAKKTGGIALAIYNELVKAIPFSFKAEEMPSMVHHVTKKIREMIDKAFTGPFGGGFNPFGGGFNPFGGGGFNPFARASSFGSRAVSTARNVVSRVFSDEELKDNIKPIGTTSEGIGIYQWDWNSKAKELGLDNQPNSGVIAQQVQKIVPSAIYKGMSDYLMVDYSKLNLRGFKEFAMGGLAMGPSHSAGGILAELEGGEYVMNKDSVSSVGLGIMSSLNSGGGSFTDKLVSNSSMNNQLLSRLIQVVEEKDMSVTVMSDDRGDTGTRNDIRLSRQREMEYRGARSLA